MKIRTKIALLFTALVASLLVIFSFVIFGFASHYRTKEFKLRLVNKGKTITNLLINVDEIDTKLLNTLRKSSYNRLKDENIWVFDRYGNMLYSNHEEKSFHLGEGRLWELLQQEEESYFEIDNVEYVSFFYATKMGRFLVVVSATDEYGHQRMLRLKYILVIGILLSTLIIFITGWFFAQNALKPISSIIHEVQEISGKDLSHRLSSSNNSDELANLSNTFNQMLDRIQRTLLVQKSFLANASHELRTPLSVIRARIEIALTSPNPNHIETLERLYEEVKELIVLSNSLLEITQIEGGLKKEMMSTIRLDELLYSAISDCKRKYPNQKIELQILTEDEDDEILIRGYELLLLHAFTNLIDNACKYSSGLPVSVAIEHTPEYIRVAITDEGIGIPAEQLEFVKKPFFRASNTGKFPGHGIGLSLVKKILDEHNATLKILSAVDKGTTVQVFFTLLREPDLTT